MNKKTGFITTIAILLFASTAFGCYLILFTSSDSRIAEIKQNDKVIKTIDLNTVKEMFTFEVKGDNNRNNVIEVSHGKIKMLSANCPDKTCVKLGYTGERRIPVVCLPNHIIITIKDETGDNIDATVN